VNAEAVELLRALIAEVRGLRADMAERTRGALSRADRIKLETALPAICAAVGTLGFTVASLSEHANLTGDTRLRDALTTCGTGRAIGKLLRRGAGHDIGGLRLRQIGNDGSNVWQVEKGGESRETYTVA